jgi:hypothetical protein
MSHANALLTPKGRLRLARGVVEFALGPDIKHKRTRPCGCTSTVEWSRRPN